MSSLKAYLASVPLRTKLAVAFAVVAAIPMFGGAAGILAHRDASRRIERANSLGAELRALAEKGRDIAADFERQHREQTMCILRARMGIATPPMDDFDELRSRIQAGLTELVTASANAGLGIDLQPVKAAHLTTSNRIRESLASVTPGNEAFAARTIEHIDTASAAVARELGAVALAIADQADNLMRRRNTEDQDRGHTLRVLLGAGTLIGILVGIAFGLATSVVVTRHIQGVGAKVSQGLVDVASAAAQVAESSQRVADSSSKQAKSAEAGTVALNQISSMVRRNEDSAVSAREISRASRNSAEGSARAAVELQQSMEAMAGANARIADIVKSIHDIAFQTNILALNAAVEAARAGNAGSGFAVVADEVRRLALRSGEAARETAEKVNEATTRSSQSAAVADRLSQSICAVGENTKKVDALIAEIADGCVQQSKGVEQSVAAVKRIEGLTHDNAAVSEQTASAAAELDSQVGRMRQQLAALIGSNNETATAATPA